MSYLKKHSEAVVGVLFYLAIVTALLLFLGLYRTFPPPEEEGIVLDFGGSGSGTPDPGPPSPVRQTQASQEPRPVVNATPNPNQSQMTQNFEESVSVPSNPNPTTTEEQTENNTPEEETPTVNENVSNVLNTNWGATSNTGTAGTGSGNPGIGNSGSGGSGNGSGSGSGNVAGNGWALAGRSAKSLPKPMVANCDGYVIVVIEVNQQGEVINAYPKPGGCTACEANCVDKAVASARKARFNADKNAKAKQRGTITYNFKPQ